MKCVGKANDHGSIVGLKMEVEIGDLFWKMVDQSNEIGVGVNLVLYKI